MRILYYSPHPNLNLTDPAGYGTHMREMIAAFRALGHEVRPVIMGGTDPRPANGPPKRSLIKSIAKRLIPGKRWETMKDKRLVAFDRQAQQHLASEISAFQPDLIYERANYMQVSGVRAALEAGVPHVLEVNSPYTEEKEELEGPTHMVTEANSLEREQLRKTRHVVVVSSSLRDYLLDKHQLNRKRFSVVPNAIDPDKLGVEEAEVKGIRQRWDLEGKVVVGWVGSIQPWHGIREMIDGFAGLAEDVRKNARLFIVGGGESLAEMQAHATGSGAGAQIAFTGSVPHAQVFPHLATMDICLLPNTKWYCSPIKIFEYGAMGKSVIASNHAAVLDVMEPDLDGLIIEPSHGALTEALRKLLPKPELRARYAAQFREKVLREHTWKANAIRVLDIYEQHLTSKKSSQS